jgi:hypothetical protein
MRQLLHHGQLLDFDGMLKKIEAIGAKQNLIECKTMFAFKKQIESCCRMFQDFDPTSS